MGSDRFLRIRLRPARRVFAAGIRAAGSRPENVGEVDENLDEWTVQQRQRAQISSRLNILTYRGAICQYRDCRWPNHLETNDAECRATGVHSDIASRFQTGRK